MNEIREKTSVILFAAGVIGAAIGINGLFIVDELVLIALALAMVLGFFKEGMISINAIKRNAVELFFLMALIINATISIIIVNIGIIEKVRYAALYISLFYFYTTTASLSLRALYDSENNIKSMQKILILYFVATLIQGVWFEIIIGLYDYSGTSGEIYEKIQGRYYSQGNFWVGSAYFTIPTLILLYLTTLCKAYYNKYIYTLLIVISFYFDSRTMLVMIALFIPVGLIEKVNRKTIISNLVIVLLLISMVIYDYESIDAIFSSAFNALMFNPRDSDMDRFSHLTAILEIFNEKPAYFLFGGGWQSHKIDLSWVIGNATITRTSGLVGFIIDTGVVGVILYALVIMKLFGRIYRGGAGGHIVNFYTAMAIIFSVNVLLFVTYPWESILFLIFIMSGGGRFENRKTVRRC